MPGILAILDKSGYDGYYNLEFGGDGSDELIRKSLAVTNETLFESFFAHFTNIYTTTIIANRQYKISRFTR